MKTSAVVLVLVGTVAVSAQGFPANMPDCGRLCGNNMLGQAGSLGCGAGDTACLCRNVNFGYGVRDCSLAVCNDNSDVNTAISWANQVCSDAGAPLNLAPVADEDTTTTVTAESSVSPTAVTTSSFTSVVSDSTVTGETTLSGTDSTPLVATSTTVTSAIVSTGVSGTSSFTTTVGSTTFTTSTSAPVESTDSAESSSAAPSSSSSAMGAQKTAAPIAGFLAAAGLVAALL